MVVVEEVGGAVTAAAVPLEGAPAATPRAATRTPALAGAGAGREGRSPGSAWGQEAAEEEEEEEEEEQGAEQEREEGEGSTSRGDRDVKIMTVSDGSFLFTQGLDTRE